jgi:hypothetical protein
MTYSQTPSAKHIFPQANEAHWPLAMRLLPIGKGELR